MTGYAVHVLMPSPGTVTDERTMQVADLDAAIAAIREAVTTWPDFRAVTLVRGEHFSALMAGATEHP